MPWQQMELDRKLGTAQFLRDPCPLWLSLRWTLITALFLPALLSPLSLSLSIFLLSLEQENWLLYQHSFQSYCLTHCLCQEFQKSFETKKLRIGSFVPCSPEACPGFCLQWVEGHGSPGVAEVGGGPGTLVNTYHPTTRIIPLH